MNTKVVYVLTSSSSDFYLEELWMSAFTLKYYQPDAIIEVVTDQDTYASLTGYRHGVLRLINNIVKIDCPIEYSSIYRSRFLKTNLRNLISGDYLFVDTDTIFSGKIEEIDQLQGNLCAVRDYYVPSIVKGKPSYDRAKIMGWNEKMEGQPYYNSGVLYVKDNTITRDFYKSWHENWLECCKKEIHYDQISLCKTNIDYNYIIQEIPDVWNYQIKYHPILETQSKIKIYHYFTSVSARYTMFEIETPHLINRIRKLGDLPEYLKEDLVKSDSIFSKRLICLNNVQKRILYGSLFEAIKLSLLLRLSARFPSLNKYIHI